MARRIYNYYAGGNTAEGFYDLFPEVIQQLERVFILKGGPGTGKSTLMKKIGEKWGEKYDIEYVHCSADYGSIDGVIIPALKIGVIDGTDPHVVEPRYPGIVEEYINLGESWDSEKLRQHKEDVAQVKSQIKACYDEAYQLFAEALRIHDDWEKIYINNIDVEKAEELTNYLKETFFGTISLHKNGNTVHRFLGAATPDGPKDFIQNLTDDVPKRYFIKGRPGSGKSTMLKKLVSEAEQRGIDVEVYHCGFDPHSLDMLIFRELGIAIFDSTSPHEHFPSRKGDEIVDMYEEVITPGTDEKYKEQIQSFANQYKQTMQKATSKLKESNILRNKLESYYIESVDFSVVEQKQKEIEAAIEKWEQLV
ncbi:PRK06851 family protein [Salinibacillus xinjiangensis]|uniref:Uncharacterized protein n=1 Tax=Salinibacillus xinjiangensis TaxID=1229268 RepID=A0A6G1X5J6_9BACI|nr:PRK06851 family protein [Salinibacillus xinjiangensis]MRG86273.1 hypothetical protein [Salinibacillus xinjiangensis]